MKATTVQGQAIKASVAPHRAPRLAFLFAVPIGILGGLLVGLVPAAVLKVGLGLIMIASVLRIFRGLKQV